MVQPAILIADNDPALRQKLYAALFGLGLRADVVGDVIDALDKLAERPYALVLIDAALAGGADPVLRRIEMMPRHRRPILLVTAEAEAIRTLDGESVQFVMRRPLRVREAAELIRACVDVRGRGKSDDATRELSDEAC